MQRDGGLRGGQLDGLALVLVAMSAALLASSGSSAWSAARGNGWMLGDRPNEGVLVSGVDWEAFFQNLALTTTPVHLLLLGGAIALVGRRGWQAAGRPGHVVVIVVLVLGLVLAGTAGLATWYVATSDGSDGLGVDVGNRLVAAGVYAVSSLGLAYVAWCASALLPVNAPPVGEDAATGTGQPDA